MTRQADNTPESVEILRVIARAPRAVGAHYVAWVIGSQARTVSTWLTKLRQLYLLEVVDVRDTGYRPLYLYRVTDLGEAVLARQEAAETAAVDGAYVR